MSGMRASPELSHSEHAGQMTSAAASTAVLPADASMSAADALAYWTSVPATVDGMLGGYEPITRVDLQGSRNFLAKLRRRRYGQGAPAPPGPWLARAADCGAGIGRITQGLLVGVAHVVDVVEPVAKFAAAVASGADFAALRAAGRIGHVHVLGLERWLPAPAAYDLLWHQWCLGQLTDAQLVAYLGRARAALQPHGWLVVKENLSTAADDADMFDDQDSSVTRAEGSWRRLFAAAGLRVVAEEVQRGFPAELLPVKSFALQPLPND